MGTKATACVLRADTVLRVAVYDNDDDVPKNFNFIVGLSDDFDPDNSTVEPWSYGALCGQYPDVVPVNATVSIHCPYNVPPYRYVIVQLPLDGQMSICEVEVFAISK